MLRVRAATLADLDALMELERACFSPRQAFSRREYRGALAGAGNVNLVAEEDGALCAFIGVLLDGRTRVGNVFTLNVHPSARRRGHGAHLLREAERRLVAAGAELCALEVNVDNEAAIRLYEECGYERVARLPDYYASGYASLDAWRYARALRRDPA
ncbi:MAG: GNAT family N-acetyltransferase [Halobacteriales archaeon]|nr:GNAT family N-acetyltransferase [Halobacteriales archaeon]